MYKAIIIVVLISLGMACAAEPDNVNTPSNGPETTKFNGQPLDKSGKPIPGIPDPKNANISNRAPGATPTPGIPEANKADITNKKGATPTPGIPDEATRRRMAEQIHKNANAVNTAPKVPPADKTTKRGPINRPRKAQP